MQRTGLIYRDPEEGTETNVLSLLCIKYIILIYRDPEEGTETFAIEKVS